MIRNVSVVLTCYNGARWIGKAIRSIQSQTYEDFELVIVDDGSIDNSREIVDLYLCDERVRYIYQRNRGFSAAVNRGIKESCGNLIGFIGQDDLWTSDKLELQVNHLRKHVDVDLVHSNYYSIDSKGRLIGVVNANIPYSYSRKEAIEHLFLDNFIGFETVLVKRKCFDDVGLFDERMVAFSDHDMWLRIAGTFNLEGYIDRLLVKKREHGFRLSKMRMEAALKDEFLMVQKAMNQYPFLKRVERKKLASLYFKWGSTLLQEGNNKNAKRLFAKVIRCQPWKLKAAVAYITPSVYSLMWDHYQKTTPEIRSRLKWLEG